MAAVFELRQARKKFAKLDVFDIDHLQVQPGETVALVGPSGCGKTTMLMAMAGLEPLSSGLVSFMGKPVTSPPSSVGAVFQRSGVFPWLRVEQNVQFAGRLDEPSEYLGMFGLGAFLRAWPRQLSGGMLRRLELARAVARKPSALLLDEPFSALDPVQKDEMHELLRRVRREFVSSVILVTHDVEEAVALADRVIVLSPRPGKVVAEIQIEIPATARSINSISSDFTAARAAVLRALGWHNNAT